VSSSLLFFDFFATQLINCIVCSNGGVGVANVAGNLYLNVDGMLMLTCCNGSLHFYIFFVSLFSCKIVFR